MADEEPEAEAPAEEPAEEPAEVPAEEPAEAPAEEPEQAPVEELVVEPAAAPLEELPIPDDIPPPDELPPPDQGVTTAEATSFEEGMGEEEEMLPIGEVDDVLDPNEEKRLSEMYRQITLQIVTQNKIISEFKEKIKSKCMKYPRTACEEREICNLKICMEQENLKLQCLVKNAMAIQSRDPDRKWPPIPLETTLDEDCMPLRVNYNAMTNCFGPLKGDYDQRRPSNHRQRGSDMRGIPPDTSTDMSSTGDSYCAKAVKSAHAKSKRGSGRYSKELSRSYNMQEKLVADNADLEGDRYKLQEELLSRDRTIECLQQKVCLMHAELTKLCRKSHGLHEKERKCPMDELPKLKEKLREQDSSTKCLSNAMDKIQNALDCLRLEMDGVKKHRERSDQRGTSPDCDRPSKNERNEIQNMKQKYCDLLEDYALKERELCELKDKVNAFIDGGQMSASKQNDDHREAEARLLREKMKELREEQEEFKVIICEQSRQTDEYREKYMASLQKIEELKCILQRMEVDNKRVEDQINLEIQRIKDKFQEKLQEWAHLPQVLENEQVKLAQCCKEKDDIEAKLRIVCRELKTLKGKKIDKTDDKSDELRALEQELAELKTQYDMLLECKNRLCEKYDRVKTELDVLRQESAKVICRLKERAQNNQASLQKHIDQLEIEVAQCRATACLSISDREEVIKDMQAQLNCLGTSFDSAQKQIKSLKDHISYLSGGKANSVVICCQNEKL